MKIRRLRILQAGRHFDHVRGFTARVGETIRPRFPNARYLIRRDEWADATHTHERNRASYLADDFVPLEAAGVVELIEGEYVIFFEHDPSVAAGIVRRGGSVSATAACQSRFQLPDSR